MRCARLLARCSSWVTSRIVCPRRLRSSRRASTDLAVAGVERAGRLVGEEHGRPVDDGPSDRHALPLAAAQRRRDSASRTIGQAQLAEQLVGPGAASAATRPPSSAATATLSTTVRSSSRWKNWKTKPTFARRKRAAAASLRRSTRTPSTSTSPRVGRSSAADEVEQRRLAAPRRAHDRGDPAGLDVEADAVEGGPGGAVVAPSRRRASWMSDAIGTSCIRWWRSETAAVERRGRRGGRRRPRGPDPRSSERTDRGSAHPFG